METSLSAIQQQRKELLLTKRVKKGNVVNEMKELVEMMDVQLNKSQGMNLILNQDQTTLRKVDKEYDTLEVNVGFGKRILKKLEGRDRKDRIYLYSGLGIFLSVCIYVIIKRLFL